MGLQQTVAKWIAHSKGRPGGGSGGFTPSSVWAEVPYIDADFTSQEYLQQGTTIGIADFMVENSAVWGDFDPAVCISSEGLLLTTAYNADSTPTIPASLLSNINDAEFTIVCTVLPALQTNYIFLDFFDNPDFNSDWGMGVYFESANDSYIYSGVGNGGDTLGGGYGTPLVNNTFAYRISPTSISLCLNGSPVITQSPTDFAVVKDTIGFVGDVHILTMKIYNTPKTDAELIQLTG